jgi:hypothetical protein
VHRYFGKYPDLTGAYEGLYSFRAVEYSNRSNNDEQQNLVRSPSRWTCYSAGRPIVEGLKDACRSKKGGL